MTASRFFAVKNKHTTFNEKVEKVCIGGRNACRFGRNRQGDRNVLSLTANQYFGCGGNGTVSAYFSALFAYFSGGVGNARWGVRNYLHADLAVEASNSGSTASFGEILSLFVRDSFASDQKLDCLEGSATWFLQQMLMSDTIKEMLRGTVSANSIGKHMGALAASGSFPLHYKRCHGGRLWWITRKEFESYTSFDRQMDFLDPLTPF